MKKVVIIIITILVAVGAIFEIATLMKNNNKDNLQANNENVNGETVISSDEQEKNGTMENTISKTETNSNSKTLIAYFSLPETKGDAKEDSTVTVNGEALRKYTICSKFDTRAYRSRHF